MSKSVLYDDRDTLILLQHIDIEGWLADVSLAWLKCIKNWKGRRTSLWQPIKAWRVGSSHISCGIYKWWVATFSPFQLSITYSDWQKLILEFSTEPFSMIFNDILWCENIFDWKYFSVGRFHIYQQSNWLLMMLDIENKQNPPKYNHMFIEIEYSKSWASDGCLCNNLKSFGTKQNKSHFVL